MSPIDHTLLAEATNPGTSQVRLAWLAEHYPELRPHIANNPNVYPELAEWIRAQGGLAQTAPSALTRRRRLIWGIVVTAVVIVVAAIALASFFLGRSSSRGTQSDTSSGGKPLDVQINQVDTSKFPEVTLYFAALAADGVPVTTIEQSDLAVSEGGAAPLPLVGFLAAGDERNLAISLVLDASSSMAGEPMTQAQDSALRFLDYVDLPGGDRVEVAEFNTESYIRLPYSTDRATLDAAIRTIEPDGGTALLDAAYSSLVRAYAQPGQKAVIIFTDGLEAESTVTVEEVVALSQKVHIPVYVVGIGSDVDEPMLASLAAQTGGEYFFSPTAADLADIYQDVYDDEQLMYAATFVSNAKDYTSLIDLQLTIEGRNYSGQGQAVYEPNIEAELPLELLYSGVSASSTLAPQNASDVNMVMEYLPFHAFDGRNDTTWAEGSAGDGVGEWLQIDFARPSAIAGFDINNGYWRIPKRIAQNGRVKTMRVTFSDGSSEVVNLRDPADAQWIDYYAQRQWPTEELPTGQTVFFASPHTTSSLRFTVESVYPGNTWDDLCITSIVPFR